MLLKSTINPTESNLDVPVAIFCFGERRLFLKRSLNYEEMICTVRERFGIDSKYTVSLATSSLDVCKGNEIEIDESAYSLMCSVLDEIIVIYREKTLSKTREKAKAPITPRTTPLADLADPEQVAVTTSGAKIRTPAKHERPVPGPSRTHDDEEAVGKMLFNDDEEVEQEEKEEEEEEEKEVPPNEPVHRTKIRRSEPKGKARERDVFDSPERSPIPIKEPVEDQPLTIKEEKVTKPTSEPIAIDPDENKRFSISVMGPHPTHRAEFKTRGKHPVKKILAAACKTFGLDYEGASLYLLVEDQDEHDGSHNTYHRSRCNLDETVTRCGIEEGSVLEVRLSGGGEGDSEGSEPDEWE